MLTPLGRPPGYRPPWDTSQAGGTHPTGMHTCIHFCAWSTSQENVICDSFFLPDEPDFGWDVRYLSIGTGNVYVSCALHNTVSKLISCSFCPGFYMLYSQCDTTKLMRTNCGRTETRAFRWISGGLGILRPLPLCTRNEWILTCICQLTQCKHWAQTTTGMDSIISKPEQPNSYWEQNTRPLPLRIGSFRQLPAYSKNRLPYHHVLCVTQCPTFSTGFTDNYRTHYWTPLLNFMVFVGGGVQGKFLGGEYCWGAFPIGISTLGQLVLMDMNRNEMVQDFLECNSSVKGYTVRISCGLIE